MKWSQVGRDMIESKVMQTEHPVQVIVTCEHGGNEVPEVYRYLFRDAPEVLKTHRGWDPGALFVADSLANDLRLPLFSATTTRLLIDLNRSLNHEELFSTWSNRLSLEEKENVIREYYLPYRQQVETVVQNMATTGFVLHLSIHSFTPTWDGVTRPTEIGILFDPARKNETKLSHLWKSGFDGLFPGEKVHFNLPYHGTSDGFTTALRTQFTDARYAGLELEVNQKLLQNEKSREDVAQRVVRATEELSTQLMMNGI